MTKALLIASAASLTFSLSCWGQGAQGIVPQPAQSQPTQDTHTSSSSSSSGTPYGEEIPVFDQSSESVSFMGQKYSLADSVVADQFTGYLVQTPAKIEEAAKYRKIIREILDTLDRGTPGLSTEARRKKAYDLLGEAAKYPQDFNISESLKNSLIIALQANNKSNQNDAKIIEMKERYKRLIKQMDFYERGSSLSGSAPSAPAGEAAEGEAPAAAQPASGGVKQQENSRARLELLALMKKEEVSGNITEKLAKFQFQAMLMQLFMQRRFEHCVIGCRFYNLLFSKGENQLKIEKGSELHKFFSDTLGVQPTVAGLDSASNDVIGKAKTSVNSVTNHIKLGQIHQATRRMIEAYIIGEHLTTLHSFSPADRTKMHQYILDSKHLKDAIVVKNWQEAEIYTNKLKDQANDFRYIQASTAITGYKNASDLQVADYRIAMREEDRETANAAMKQAIDLWPTNPAITKAKLQIVGLIEGEMDKLETLENKKVEFEGIVRNKDYRSVSIKDAGAYQEMFRQAKDNTKLNAGDQDAYRLLHAKATELYNGLEDIETAVRSARGLADRSQYYEAWEAITLELDKDHLEESRLRDALSEYSSRASKFSDLFTEAEELIESKNYGSALSCYLKAQSLFTKSKLASQGIEKLMATTVK